MISACINSFIPKKPLWQIRVIFDPRWVDGRQGYSQQVSHIQCPRVIFYLPMKPVTYKQPWLDFQLVLFVVTEFIPG